MRKNAEKTGIILRFLVSYGYTMISMLLKFSAFVQNLIAQLFSIHHLKIER
jgi:hypothetical protein